MAKITTIKAQDCGITLGGIGTGSVELFPDGEFHQWQIANPDSWAFSLNGKPNASDGEEHTGALSFWVRTQAEGETPVFRKLGLKTDERDFRYSMFAWNKPVEAIEFDGKFPVAEVRYIDSAMPIEVSMKAVSPFVPHNLRDSATPGFYLDFELTTPTDTPITVSLLSLLRPTFCNEGGCVNQLYTDGDTTGIYLTPAPAETEEDEGKILQVIGGAWGIGAGLSTDATFKTAGAAADAKATGDRLLLIERNIADILYKAISVMSETRATHTTPKNLSVPARRE